MHKKASAAQASPNSSIKIALYRAGVMVLACLPSSLAAQQTAYSYNSPGDLTAITQALASAPSFTLQPGNQIVSHDGNVYFSFVATSAGPFSYQWLSKGKLPFPDPGQRMRKFERQPLNGQCTRPDTPTVQQCNK